MARHQQWHLSGWVAILLAPLAIIVAGLIQLAVWLFGLKDTADLTREDVLGYLEDYLEGRGGEWDWDDFTSIRITDPLLDQVRQDADALDYPLTDEGRTELVQLVQRVRAL